MLTEEFYDIILENLVKELQSRVVGKVLAHKEEDMYRIEIIVPRIGICRYTIFEVNEINFNEVGSKELADLVILWHEKRIRRLFFY